MTDDNPRITALTTDAIRSIGDKMVEEIRKQVAEVEYMAESIRELAKCYEEEIGARTLELTDHIAAYTALGAKTTEMFKTMSDAMKGIKTNGNEPTVHVLPTEPMRTPMPEVKPTRGPRPVNFDDEMGKLAALAPSPVDGRR